MRNSFDGFERLRKMSYSGQNHSAEDLIYAVIRVRDSDLSENGRDLILDNWSSDAEEVADVANDARSQVIERLSGESKNEAAAFNALVKDVLSMRLPLEDFRWTSNSASCECVVYATGAEIVPKAIEFFEDHIGEGGLLEADANRVAIIRAAQEHPNDYDRVLALLSMISDAVAEHNQELD